jgi:hypothetical protein
VKRPVGVEVGVSVWSSVLVAVADIVAVGMGVAAEVKLRTNLGALAPDSRLGKLSAVLPGVVTPKL